MKGFHVYDGIEHTFTAEAREEAHFIAMSLQYVYCLLCTSLALGKPCTKGAHTMRFSLTLENMNPPTLHGDYCTFMM